MGLLIEDFLCQFDDFWMILKDLDDHCFILDRSKTFRRIAVKDRVCIHFTINPNHPRQLEKCCFLGPDEEIIPQKRKFDENVCKWDAKLTPRENLQTLLALTLPPQPPPSAKVDDTWTSSCPICMEYDNEGELTTIVCPKCVTSFHHSCLKDWFLAQPASRQTFQTING